MESQSAEEILIESTMDILRGESNETLEALRKLLLTLKQVHGSLGKGLDHHLNIALNKMEDSVKRPEVMSSYLENVEKVFVRPRVKLFDINRKDHPMRNNVVLRNVFRFCPIETLKSCRLVSKEWKTLSMDAFSSKAVVKVLYQQEEHRLPDLEETFERPFQCVRATGVGNWTKETRLAKLVPNLTYLDFIMGVNQWSNLDLIFSNFHELRYLSLRLLCGTPFFNEPLQLKSFVPKLKTFNLCFTGYERMENFAERAEQVSNEVFDKVPSLEALRVKFNSANPEANVADWITDQGNALRKILTAAMNVRLNSNFSVLNLSEFNISQPSNEYVTTMSPDIVDMIRACQFPLKSLCVDIGKGTTPSTIRSLLEDHATTLKYFRTILMLEEIVDGEEACHVTLFPDDKVTLPKLERMEIVSEAPTAFHFLGSLNVAKLEILIITQEKAEQLPKYSIGKKFYNHLKNTDVCSQNIRPALENVHFPDLKRFQYWGRVYFSENELHAMAKAMPNLKHLQMNICAKTFSTVCKLWPRLWTLLLTSPDEAYPVIDDFALTGLEFAQSNSNLQGTPGRKPNITDLKELTDFTYLHYFDGISPSWELTSQSVTHGFLQLPRLHFLDVGFRKLSFEAKMALENYVPNLHVFCEEYHFGDWKITSQRYFDWRLIVTKEQPTTEEDDT